MVGTSSGQPYLIGASAKIIRSRAKTDIAPPKSLNANLSRLRYFLPPSDHDTPTNPIRLHPPPRPTTTTPTTANMPGVSVRDVEADKFINAYAAFLKRQGKLPIPGP
ncbi:hypothetical protein KC319_g10670 [Hortaea werneckii]|nr:hypothetical protein KC317_g11749 [Hortaea werneckii]KAI7606113.1 hypothetical protein KC346_g10706 [Hortaea werneckii]KAI7652740.1 hypothetical protein KC319_g10670 [Hortaea werneckii]KAI7693409.1 hypothetical protein KC322_g10749 [Hortaea werneckii]